MKKSVFSYVIALCLIIASTTHTFAFHFPAEHAGALSFASSSSSQQSASVIKPAGCSNVAATKSLFVVQKMWVIGNIASVEDHQRCHAAISSAVEHAGISPASEFVRPQGKAPSLILFKYDPGFKNWRFKPPLRPPQIG
ncbi:hypothetical protein MNBD_ALPHA12-1363 [hydrothermal vent metagenome]|uniref:Uncharacterized protein n=1 Tax=hydrothermal vent metagenome TaxID=652676 RepID=A0A3B0U3Z6_9ZZZZ